MPPLVPDGVQGEIGPRYTIEREIGRGGMATVYLACDTKHGRKVAVKVLHEGLAGSLGADRFRREIAMLAQLQHPHILSVYDSGDSETRLWFAMPYVEGESLRDRLKRETQLPIDEALRFTRDIASALSYAHGRDIIHRDIKPENILLTPQGDALLADFGIARIVGPDAAAELTGSGVAIGTPQYMSPEQASGARDVDARTDIFSLGAILYEMLVGEAPFPGPTPQVVIVKMLSGALLSLQSMRPGVPPAVDAAVRKALAVVPADRWASAAEFAGAIETRRAPTTPPTHTTSSSGPVRRPIAQRVITVVVGLALVVGALVVGTLARARSTALPAAPIRLAVLPFEYVGDSSSAYFAEGMADAVRGKLIGLPGLDVIGSTSSGRYRHTTKSAREIGQALEARYLLEGRVRWEKAANGSSHVRVSAELVDAGTSTDKWAQPFDAPVTDVFRVQNTIAGQVAQQLQVELTPELRHSLAKEPTASVSAYDAYLHGEALTRAGGVSAQMSRLEAAYYQQAVNRDSTFALAWAALANAQAQEYTNGIPTTALADSADFNSIRALTLGYDLPDAHTARANYYRTVRHDPVRAMHQDSAALVLAPGDANTLRRVSEVEAVLGRWAQAEEHIAAAARLDPQSVLTADQFGNMLVLRGHYDQARAVFARATAMDSENLNLISDQLVMYLVQGDSVGGRKFLRSVPSGVHRDSLIAYLATYGDFGWAFDSGDANRLLRLGPDAFDGDRSTWAFALTQEYARRGDVRRTQAYADTARASYAAELAGAPPDPERLSLLALSLAYMGRYSEAIHDGETAGALLPVSRDAEIGPYIQHQLVRVFILAGEPKRALDTLEPLVKVPYVLTPGWLRIDPNFDPLRGDPRFQRLVSP